MSGTAQQSFRFATAAQWRACLSAGVKIAHDCVRLFPTYAPSVALGGAAARAPAISDAQELLWLDDAGVLHRLPFGWDAPRQVPAPFALAAGASLHASGDTLWAVRDSSVEAYDLANLARIVTIDVP